MERRSVAAFRSTDDAHSLSTLSSESLNTRSMYSARSPKISPKSTSRGGAFISRYVAPHATAKIKSHAPPFVRDCVMKNISLHNTKRIRCVPRFAIRFNHGQWDRFIRSRTGWKHRIQKINRHNTWKYKSRQYSQRNRRDNLYRFNLD